MRTASLVMVGVVVGVGIVAVFFALFVRDDDDRSRDATESLARPSASAEPSLTTEQLTFLQALSTQAAASPSTPIPRAALLPSPVPAPPEAPTVRVRPLPPIPAPAPPTPPPAQRNLDPVIDGTWVVSVTVTAVGGAGPSVGTRYGRTWVLTTHDCYSLDSPEPACLLTINSSSGNIFSGNYQPRSPRGVFFYAQWSQKPPPQGSAACVAGELVEGTVTATISAPDGLMIATQITGTDRVVVNYPNVVNPPPGCAFADYGSTFTAVRSD